MVPGTFVPEAEDEWGWLGEVVVGGLTVGDNGALDDGAE